MNIPGISLNTNISNTISMIVKIMTLVALGVYALFAFILISQIRLKRQTVATELGPFLELLAYIHFGLSIALIILAFILL